MTASATKRQGRKSSRAATVEHSQRPGHLEAVLFDMDGVVTDTADAHAAAWKRLFDAYLAERSKRLDEPLTPFDAEVDYRRYVDGKPRYDGVVSFLGSRGIELPFGQPDDEPDRETVCGLGNRKNRYFNGWLDEHRVATYPTTVSLLGQLRGQGIKTAVFTSSRNGAAVLDNAGVRQLFDAEVHGTDLDSLGLRGKPDPAMLLDAAARLGVAPQNAAVVEDALSGVEAGVAGGFGLVIGVDRGDYGDALYEHGADAVVSDLGELAFEPASGLRVKTLRSLASALDRTAELRQAIGHRRLLVFFDYDGTLTPIVADFEGAHLADDMRQALRGLARRCTVGVISGRDLAKLKQLVGLDTLLYAGSHGFEIEMPDRQQETLQRGKDFLPDLDKAERELRQDLRGIEGHAVERKRFAIAVHYRRVATAQADRIEDIVDEVLHRHPRLRKADGKKVFEARPRLDWDKGHALRWLGERLGLDESDALPIYVGDDLTDEDAFRALAGWGIAVAVADGDRATSAHYSLRDPQEVGRFIALLTGMLDEETCCASGH